MDSNDKANEGASDSPSAPQDGKPAPFTLTASRQFTSWLAETGASLAVTTYQSGKVILVGTNKATGRLSVFERTLERPMGLAFDGKKLAIATVMQITTFVDADRGTGTAEGYDAVFVPQSASFHRRLDAARHGLRRERPH